MIESFPSRHVVHFPAYRAFDSLRVVANDALMALLIGGRVGRAALESSDPDEWLPDVVQVEDARRLNLRVGSSKRLIESAEQYLSVMGIPFTVSVYQGFLGNAIKFLQDAKVDSSGRNPFKFMLDDIHPHMKECGVELESDLCRLFDVVRLMRNRILHAAGIQGSAVRSTYKQLPKTAHSWWEERTGRAIGFEGSGEMLNLGPPELIGTLALTKELGRQVNEGLIPLIERETWAVLVVEDYRAGHPDKFKLKPQIFRSLKGFANNLYAPLSLSEEELTDAYQRVLDAGS
jgi:hypothetical protein